MPGLTVTEKSHWRDRIAARIDKAVERIKARHPALFDRIAREAHAQALTSLGLAEAHAELEAIKAEEAALARRKKHAQRSMIATLRSVPIDEVGDSFSVRYGGDLGLPHEVAEAITRRQAAHQEQLLADDPIGREIARLEAEKDNAARHRLAGDLADPDQATLDQGRRAARRRADDPGARGAGDRAGRRRPDAEETTDRATPARPASAPSLLRWNRPTEPGRLHRLRIRPGLELDLARFERDRQEAILQRAERRDDRGRRAVRVAARPGLVRPDRGGARTGGRGRGGRFVRRIESFPPKLIGDDGRSDAAAHRRFS